MKKWKMNLYSFVVQVQGRPARVIVLAENPKMAKDSLKEELPDATDIVETKSHRINDVNYSVTQRVIRGD